MPCEPGAGFLATARHATEAESKAYERTLIRRVARVPRAHASAEDDVGPNGNCKSAWRVQDAVRAVPSPRRLATDEDLVRVQTRAGALRAGGRTCARLVRQLSQAARLHRRVPQLRVVPS